MSSERLHHSVVKFILVKISNFFRLIGGLLFFGIITTVYGLMYFSTDIPDYSSLQNYNPPTITRLYSQNFELLTEYASEPRIFTKVDDMPRILLNAFIAAEDKTFFENYGIDPMGILRSAVKNIENLSTGKRATGASTITQQVVQSFIIGKKRTLDRKIFEAILAYRISMKLSKEKILELYLNQIFLGNNSYGVTQAAKTYFNKNLNQLNIAEVAMLASLPKAPSALNPYTNPDRLIERRNWVIQRMYEDGMISEDEKIEYAKMDLNVVSKRNNQKENTFYTEEVKKQLIDLYGENAVHTNGLTVNTNLNEFIQAAAVKSLQYGIESYDKRHGWRGPIGKILNIKDWKNELKIFSQDFIRKNGPIHEELVFGVMLDSKTVGANNQTYNISFSAWPNKFFISKGSIIIGKIDKAFIVDQIPSVNGAMIVMENYTGKVLALVGGYNANTTQFNRATQAQRQPGSAFKTFIYLSAIENGFSKDSILIDEPIEISQGKGMPNWRPQNLTHKFNGAVTMQEAFSRSLNIPAIQIGLTLGLEKIYEVSSRLGLYPKQSNSEISCVQDEIGKKYCKNYSLLLGAFETTLMQLTTAYAIIASGGYEIQPHLINSIYDNHGRILYRDSNFSIFTDENSAHIRNFNKKIIKTNANMKILGMLQHAVASQSKELKITIAGKTGTTNDSLDTWFIGSSKELTVGVFVGYDLPKSLGKKEIGATVARPIFVHFMKSLKSIENGDIGKGRQAIEFINTNDESESTDSEQDDIESISEILRKKPNIQIDLQNDCPDCEDAFSVKSYMQGD